MKDIHEMMLWSDTCVFSVHKTTVLIPKSSFFKCAQGSKFIHFDKSCVKISQNHTWNLDKVFLKLPPSSDFGSEVSILLKSADFIGQNEKKSKNQHRKTNIPLSSIFYLETLTCWSREKSNSGKPGIWIMSFWLFSKKRWKNKKYGTSENMCRRPLWWKIRYKT